MRRILVLLDDYNWALDYVFQVVQPILSHEFDIHVAALVDIPGWLPKHKLLQPISRRYYIGKRHDYFSQFSNFFVFYSLLLKILPDKARSQAGCGVHCHYEFTDNASQKSLIRTLESPQPEFLEQLGRQRLLAVPSLKLVNILQRCGLRVRHIPNGVDITIFYPDSERPALPNGFSRPLRIGWAQSESNHGFKRRIAEIRRVCAKIPNLELVEIPQDRPIRDRQAMRLWYNSLDCYVCFSICEGGPMPVLEAMACGIPCVSTPVGHVPEIVEHDQNGWIVNDESELESRLRYLAAHRERIIIAGQYARNSILQHRTAEKIAPYWIQYFQELCLESSL